MDFDIEQLRAGLERLAHPGGELSPKKEATRQRILAAATEVLTERGFRRASMEAIAERAGVSRGTLYTHVKSKEDVVIQGLAREQLGQLQAWAEVLEPSRTPKERLRRLFVHTIESYAIMPLLALLVRGDAELLRSLEKRPEVMEAFGGLDDRKLWEGLVGEAFGELAPERIERSTAVLLTLGSMGPGFVDWAPAHGLSTSEFAESLAQMLIEGIGGQTG